MRKEIHIKENEELIAYCGLYCAACSSFLKGTCSGCKENAKAVWCKVRLCCRENEYENCAHCKETHPEACKKFNSLISITIGLFTKMSRAASIQLIKKDGPEAYAKKMTAQKSLWIKKKQWISLF